MICQNALLRIWKFVFIWPTFFRLFLFIVKSLKTHRKHVWLVALLNIFAQLCRTRDVYEIPKHPLGWSRVLAVNKRTSVARSTERRSFRRHRQLLSANHHMSFQMTCNNWFPKHKHFAFWGKLLKVLLMRNCPQSGCLRQFFCRCCHRYQKEILSEIKVEKWITDGGFFVQSSSFKI